MGKNENFSRSQKLFQRGYTQAHFNWKVASITRTLSLPALPEKSWTPAPQSGAIELKGLLQFKFSSCFEKTQCLPRVVGSTAIMKVSEETLSFLPFLLPYPHLFLPLSSSHCPADMSPHDPTHIHSEKYFTFKIKWVNTFCVFNFFSFWKPRNILKCWNRMSIL